MLGREARGPRTGCSGPRAASSRSWADGRVERPDGGADGGELPDLPVEPAAPDLHADHAVGGEQPGLGDHPVVGAVPRPREGLHVRAEARVPPAAATRGEHRRRPATEHPAAEGAHPAPAAGSERGRRGPDAAAAAGPAELHDQGPEDLADGLQGDGADRRGTGSGQQGAGDTALPLAGGAGVRGGWESVGPRRHAHHPREVVVRRMPHVAQPGTAGAGSGGGCRQSQSALRCRARRRVSLGCSP